MRSIQTEIIINATAEKVWDVLTDFDQYPTWNPFIISIHGEQGIGKKLTVRIQPPGAKGMTFTPIIQDFRMNEKLRWLGSGPIKGLFDGMHSFEIERLENGKTRLIHQENFKGILVGLMKNMLSKTELGFHQMNEALKNRCEQS